MHGPDDSESPRTPSTCAGPSTLGESVRGITSPNPWVGSVVVSARDPALTFGGATAPPGGPHAEVAALARAGEAHARGGDLVHHP